MSDVSMADHIFRAENKYILRYKTHPDSVVNVTRITCRESTKNDQHFATGVTWHVADKKERIFVTKKLNLSFHAAITSIGKCKINVGQDFAFKTEAINSFFKISGSATCLSAALSSEFSFNN